MDRGSGRPRRGPEGGRLIALAALLLQATASSAAPDIERAAAAFQRRDCAPALALGEPDAALPPRAAQIGRELRMICLIMAGRKEEADRFAPQVVAGPLIEQKLALYPVQRAVETGRPADAADQLVALARRRSPALAALPTFEWRRIGSELTALGQGDRRDDLSLALAQAVWQPADGDDVRDALASGAIRALVRTGRADEATAFVEQLEAPSNIARLASLRRYETLWPALEARLGPASRPAIERYAASRLETFARQPQAASTRLDAAEAFLLLRRPADAAGVAAAVTPGDGRIGYEDVQTVLVGARASVLAGEAAGAIDRLRALSGRSGPQVESGDTAPVVPVLAALLSDAGRHQEALDLVRDTLAKRADAFTGWGLANLRLEEGCALAGLGRRAEALAVADRLVADGREAVPAAIEARLCLGDTARAAALLRDALATDDGALLLADDLQPAAARLLPVGGRRAALWADFAAAPATRAVADARVRVLPRTLWPAQTEQPLPTPRAGGPTS